jgi:hypothetical protein
MMKSLRRIDAVAKRKGMMQFIARLILAFAFVASTAHTPAIAHEEPASHHGNHGTASDHDAITENHGDAPSSHEGAGDSVHHHHCPSALDARANDIALGATSGKALLPLQRTAVLTSFSQAPPTEPPSA